jgi:low affinity Fe/Cu permease
MGEVFRRVAHRTSLAVGSAAAFCAAVLLVVAWAVLGPVFQFSDTWQLVINTATTVLTFLIVFLIQNSQNRDAKTIQLKLDELLRAVASARTGMANVEELNDSELESLQKHFRRLADAAKDIPQSSADKE